LEVFQKKTEFSNSQNFGKKVWKKVWKFKFGKSLDINQNCMSISKISKNYVKFEFLSKKKQFLSKKNLVFGSKSLEKARKFRKSSETGFSECSEISENYEKMPLNSKFENREKLVPTRKPTQKFG